ncbi:TIM barrel protein [Shinella zoogloeoides]|uniref:TIM barrel protein n=1 Tax=Shinella zoogloeoides TaxID=352475 RepID=UPI000E65951D|nr:TIM barrel protein [Shinella zoogloeoides]WPE22831.1 Inosose dehydratase [Shinella zoogloeoides]
MPVAYRLANAPCSWGVDFADRPENPAWTKVLDEAAAAGFSAIDLGPVGYFPTDPSQLKDELAKRNLVLSAGGLFDPLTDPRAFERVVDKTRRTCAILKDLGAPRLVIIDRVSDERGKYAGRSGDAPRLSADEWKAMMGRIVELAKIAGNDYGVKSYLHAHAGCYVEYEDELDRAMSDLPDDLVGLCVDTGHSAYAGIDLIGLIRRYGSRIGHMHLKNIDKQVHAACIADGTGFFDAIARGIFCPLGKGVVDFVAVRDALTAIDYRGMAVVEQDVDPTGDASPLSNARESFDYLASIGMSSSVRG